MRKLMKGIGLALALGLVITNSAAAQGAVPDHYNGKNLVSISDIAPPADLPARDIDIGDNITIEAIGSAPVEKNQGVSLVANLAVAGVVDNHTEMMIDIAADPADDYLAMSKEAPTPIARPSVTIHPDIFLGLEIEGQVYVTAAGQAFSIRS